MNSAIQKLLKDRYFLDTENNWNDLAHRVSAIYPPAEEYIVNKIFIPSSPTLMNANTNGKRLGTLSSCFPMNIDDSIDGIYEALKECAIVTKYGGGVGINFGNLRSSREVITTLDRKSSGPVPFMKNFDAMLDGIQQGGVRRGAGMGLYPIDGPDILDFIRAKKDRTTLTRLNLSVNITNSFYQQLDENPDSVHRIRYKDGSYHDLYDDGKPVTVKELWNEICFYAWDNAEPGIFNGNIAKERCSVTNLNEDVLCNP